jgi:hypothetical protein
MDGCKDIWMDGWMDVLVDGCACVCIHHIISLIAPQPSNDSQL